jgi:hypothetical protein
MSANSTVTGRLSPAGVGGGDAGLSAVGRPQPPQNFSPGSFSNPHPGQRAASGAPHSPQNRRPSRFSTWQSGQRIPHPVSFSAANHDDARHSRPVTIRRRTLTIIRHNNVVVSLGQFDGSRWPTSPAGFEKFEAAKMKVPKRPGMSVCAV